MTTLADLRPTTKMTVYAVLEELGFDVKNWETSEATKSPVDNPASNGRAYAWSFKDAASRQDVFMLWYEKMHPESDGRIVYRQSWKEFLTQLDVTSPRSAARADDFLRHVADLKKNAIVRVCIVEGSQAKTGDDQAARVERRALDGEVWHLSLWDPSTSTFEFTRGRPEKIDVQPPTLPDAADSLPPDGSARTLEVDIQAILANENDSPTEKERLVAARLGQGRFRADVLARWGDRCAATGATTTEALRASHCKPWRVCENHERLDPANGLPLVATIDALFDVGLITFANDGRLLASQEFADPTISVDGIRLSRPLTTEEDAYLAYHRAAIYRG